MTKKLMLGAALSALMLSGAFAQTPKVPNPSSPPPAATKPDHTTKPDQAMPAQAVAQPGEKKADIVMSQKPDQWLASNFKGTDVIGDDGKKIGDVSDVLFDKSGKIEAYVVSVGGFLGMGAKEVAIAPNSFTVQKGANGKPDKLRLSMTQNELKQAQNFEPYERPRPTTTGSATGSMPLGGSAPPLATHQ
jgi:sporulation protein YlmC with PRC-barrel domain